MTAWLRFARLRGTTIRLLASLLLLIGGLQAQVPLHLAGAGHAAALPPSGAAAFTAPRVPAIFVNTIPPTTTASAASSPNGAGWYSASPVVVTLSATPAEGATLAAIYYAVDQPGCSPQATSNCSSSPCVESGEDYHCSSGDSTQVQVSGDGRHQLSYFSVDTDGNKESLHILAINIDTTPPRTIGTLSGTIVPAVITLDATDNLSGVAATYYVLDNGDSTTYTGPITITTAGAHSILFYSTDKAGNVENQHTSSFTLVEASATPTSSATPSVTGTPTASPTTTATPTTAPSATPTATATMPPTATRTAVPTATPTRTRAPTVTRTATPQPTVVLPSFATGNVLAGVGENRVNVYDPSGHLLQVLNTGTTTAQEKGMCFDSSGNLYVANSDSHTISKFDRHGRLLRARWAGPFTTEPRNPESCAVDTHDHLFFGLIHSVVNKQGGELREYNPDGTLVKVFHPQLGFRGVDWIDLAHDGCTLLYTSEDDDIKRFDICTDKQLPDLVRGLEPPCYALRRRPNDEIMIACYNDIYRLDATGHVLHRYTRADLGESAHFFALNLDPDGTSFWTAGDRTGNIYRVDIATGHVITHFVAPVFQVLGALAVYGEITAVAPSLAVTGIGVANSATGATQPLAATAGGTGGAPRAISGGETIHIALNAAPHAQIDAELQVVRSQKATVQSGGKTSHVTRQVVIYQQRIQGRADASGHFQGNIPITFTPSADTAAQIVIHETMGQAVATRTIHLVIRPALPVSLQAAPQTVRTGQGLRLSVRTAPRARVTVVLTVYGAARAKGQAGPAVLWRVQRSGTAGPSGGYTTTVVVGYKAKQPTRITAVAQAQLGGRAGHAQVQLTLLPPAKPPARK